MRVLMPLAALSALAVTSLLALFPATGSAQDAKLRTDVPPEFAARLVKESKAREACKKSICEAARSKKADGPALTCQVLKTWPAQDLKEKILKGKMEWKWGHAQCEANVALDRALVAKVMSEPKLEIKVGKHKVTCNLEQEDGKEAHKLTF